MRTLAALTLIALALSSAGCASNMTPQEEREHYRHGLIFTPEPQACANNEEVKCEREKAISHKEGEEETEQANAEKAAKRANEEAETK